MNCVDCRNRMKVIVSALNEGSNLALWVFYISSDKDLLKAARNVIEQSNLACDEIIELRGDTWPDTANIQKQPITDANAPTKP